MRKQEYRGIWFSSFYYREPCAELVPVLFRDLGFELGFLTPLEIMPCYSALYPAKCGTVQDSAVPPVAKLDFRTIPAEFNPLRQRLRGECLARFRVATTGISNGVYCLVLSACCLLSIFHLFSVPCKSLEILDWCR